ncbi:MAG: FliM/FliN family flagellar motor switch protein [Methylocystis sp.]|nr:FliM/FliN family flagellar motor switch protein [Methylocystis sp.]
MALAAMEETAEQNLQGRLLAGGGISVDHLTMLQAAFERMAANFADTIRGMSAAPTYFFVDDIDAGRIGDILDSYGGCMLAAIYHAADLDSKILIGVDRGFTFSLIEALFGADGSEPTYQEDRGLSNIETRAVQFAFDHLTKALQSSLSLAEGTSFEMERVETKLDFAIIGRRNSFAVICKCKLQAFEREGEIFIVIPQSALNKFREAFSRDLSGEGSTQDPHWTKKMQDRVVQTEITIHATMEKRDLTLNDIACFEVGRVVRLPTSPTGLLKLECEGQALFWCTLGQKDGFYTIRIEDFIDHDQEFIDDVLGN